MDFEPHSSEGSTPAGSLYCPSCRVTWGSITSENSDAMELEESHLTAADCSRCSYLRRNKSLSPPRQDTSSGASTGRRRGERHHRQQPFGGRSSCGAQTTRFSRSRSNPQPSGTAPETNAAAADLGPSMAEAELWHSEQQQQQQQYQQQQDYQLSRQRSHARVPDSAALVQYWNSTDRGDDPNVAVRASVTNRSGFAPRSLSDVQRIIQHVQNVVPSAAAQREGGWY